MSTCFKKRHKAAPIGGAYETLEPRRLLAVTIDFEAASIGVLPGLAWEEAGFRFEDLPSYGTHPVFPDIYGPPQGYQSKVLHPRQWANQIQVTRTDANLFDLESLDFAAGRWGEVMDFHVVGHFEGGVTQTVTAGSDMKTLSTLDLNWVGLERLNIRFAGGDNNAYGAVDNFVFGGNPVGETSITGTLGEPDPIAGPLQIRFDGRDWNHADRVIPAADGAFYVVGAAGDTPYEIDGSVSRGMLAFNRPDGAFLYVTRHHSDGSLDTSFGVDGRTVPSAVATLLTADYVEQVPGGGYLTLVDSTIVAITDRLTVDATRFNNGVIGAPVPEPQSVTALDSGQIVVVGRDASAGRLAANGTVLQTLLPGALPGILPTLPAGTGPLVFSYGEADASGRVVFEFRTTIEISQVQVQARLLARLNPDFTLDTTFGDNGYHLLTLDFTEGVGRTELDLGRGGHIVYWMREPDGDQYVKFIDDNGLNFGTYGIVSAFDVNYTYDYEAAITREGLATLAVSYQHRSDDVAITAEHGVRIRQTLTLRRFDFNASPPDRFDFRLASVGSDDHPVEITFLAPDNDGSLLVGGAINTVTYVPGDATRLTAVDTTAGVWRVAAAAATRVVDFDTLPAGSFTGPYVSDTGLTFVNSGSGPDDFWVSGIEQGFASNVLSTTNWNRSIDIFATGGGVFDLTSLEFATNRWGDQGDFILTGYVSDGSTRSLEKTFSSRTMSVLDIDWEDLTRVRIDYGGGINNANGSIDNVRFSL